ncbi:cation:proton antiporter [Kitasatospora sp. NPDC101801]|uniref:cation:proton antiporter n=1 Tax=Kitasatospora sp. NPDC101801 TaxID=3364103 RepID=UPI003825AE62
MTSTLDLTTRLLLGLAVILGLSRGAGRIAVRLGQPPVLAEVATGIALGPTLFGRLLPDWHHRLFGPDALTVFNGLAQLGVAVYAFEIGATLARPHRDGPQAPPTRSPLPLATVSLLVPAVAGLLLTPWLHGAGANGSPAAFAVFVACAFGVTAVPVLARILQDRGLDATPVGRLSLTAASIGDGACWCLLALALWLSGRIELGNLLLGLLAVGGAAFAARYRTVRDRTVREPRRPRAAREWGVVPLLGAICLAAAVSSALGLHALFGGLVLGLLLPAADPGTDRSGAPGGAAGLGVVAAALLPCFFLGTGQQVDLGTSVTAPGFLGRLLVVLLVMTASKLLVCALAGRWYGFGRQDALRLGVLMNTKGLTEIVVLAAGHQAGIIGRELFECLLLAALLTTLAAGPALALLDRAERSGRSGRSGRRPERAAMR